MIRVEFSCRGNREFALRVRGHAGAGRRGRDLVCAGASTLAAALGRAVERLGEAGMLEGSPRVELRPGFAWVEARAGEGMEAAVALVFWGSEVGFGELAAAYPRNVALESVMKMERRETE